MSKEERAGIVICNTVYFVVITIGFTYVVFEKEQSPYWWLFGLFLIFFFNLMIYSVIGQKINDK